MDGVVDDGLRYCRVCKLATRMVRVLSSGDTICTVCMQVIRDRNDGKFTGWRAFADAGIHAQVPAAAAANRAPRALQSRANADADVSTVDTERTHAIHDNHLDESTGLLCAFPDDGTHAQLAAAIANAIAKDACKTECTCVINELHVDESTERCGRAFPDDDGIQALLAAAAAAAANDSAQLNPQSATNADFDVNVGSLPKMRGDIGEQAVDRALSDEAYNDIAAMAIKLGLEETVMDRAKEVYDMLEDANAARPKVCKGRDRDALCAACLHIACRIEGTPRTFKELASVAGDGTTAAKTKDIGRFVHVIKKRLREETSQSWDTGAVRAGSYVRRFGPLLGMNEPALRAAEEAARRVDDRFDVRRNPESIAATLIFMAGERAGADKTVQDVSKVTGVTEATIKDALRELRPNAELLFGRKN